MEIRKINIYFLMIFFIVVWIYGAIRGDKDGESSFFDTPQMSIFYGLWYSPKKWTLIVLVLSLLLEFILNYLEFEV